MPVEIRYAALGPKEIIGADNTLNEIRSFIQMHAMKVIAAINKELQGKSNVLDAVKSIDGEYGDKHIVSPQRTVTVDLVDRIPHEVYYEVICAFLDAGWSAVRLTAPSETARQNIMHVLLFTTLPDNTPPESGIVDSTSSNGSIRSYQHLPKMPSLPEGIQNSGILNAEYGGSNKPIDVLSLR